MIELEPGLCRVRAPNPSPLTGSGTNTYILGTSDLVIIDPGPNLDAHFEALKAAIASRPVHGVLVTHAHLDHSALAPRIAAETGAPIMAYGNAEAGRSAVMKTLSIENLGGGEGRDDAFQPSETFTDGETKTLGGHHITGLWTPGHFNNHLCFAWQDVVFTGDLVMGWATSLVSPPDGDLTQFMASLDQLLTRQDRVFYPGHGDEISDPSHRVHELIAHRKGRETQILTALDAPITPTEVTRRVYTDVAPHLWPAAERNVLAHLIDLTTRGIVICDGPLSRDARFRRV